MKLFPLRARTILRARRGRRVPPHEQRLLTSGVGAQPSAELPAEPTLPPAQLRGHTQSVPSMSGVISTNDAVLDEMLGKLGGFLSPIIVGPPPPPPPPQPPPAPTVALVSVTEHTVGIGNRRGTGMLGSFKVRALKGLQLDAVVRFQYWAETQEEAEALVAGLQGRLRNAANELRAEGFLRLEAATTSVAESVAAVNDFWRKSADYRVLYEFQYEDNDGAEGLVARIPIDFEGEFNETTVVTDDMVRWDKVAAPAIVVRGSHTRSRRVNALTVVAFLPAGWDGTGFVTVRASVSGNVQEQVFPHVRAFVEAFTAESDTVRLGENTYLVGRLPVEQVGFPLVLPFTLRRDDFLLISYSDAELDSDAVVYLRVL